MMFTVSFNIQLHAGIGLKTLICRYIRGMTVAQYK